MKRSDVKKTKEAYAVVDGELLLNGRLLDLPPMCVELCLERHGLDPDRNYSRLPRGIGQHIHRLGTFIASLYLAREVRLTNA